MWVCERGGQEPRNDQRYQQISHARSPSSTGTLIGPGACASRLAPTLQPLRQGHLETQFS